MIQVNALKNQRKVHNFWNNIHFHPTDAIEDDWGQVILNKVAEDRVADTVRMHVMMEDIVSRREDGSFAYDFSLIDTRIDFLLSRGFTPTLCFFAIPPCIATDPEGWGASHATAPTRYKGKRICTSPPKDYADWQKNCKQVARHLIDRYGIDQVKKWELQCYNEPDGAGFFCTSAGEGADPAALDIRLQEYIKLYTAFAAGMDEADPTLRIGGPCLAGRLSFLEGFLSYLKESGTHADFISVHAYGTKPIHAQDGSAPISAKSVPKRINEYAALVRKYFPNEKDIIMDEWGMMSQGFRNRHDFPALTVRETSVFAAYMGKMITEMIHTVMPKKLIICLSGQHEMTEEFTGYRGFFTLNGIPKPIYHAFCLCRRMGEQTVEATSDNDDISVLSTNDNGKIAILLSYAQEHFKDDHPDLKDTLTIEGLQGSYNVTISKIDRDHACPYTTFIREQMPDIPTEEQRARLMELAQVQPETLLIKAEGSAKLTIECTTNALILIELKKA